NSVEPNSQPRKGRLVTSKTVAQRETTGEEKVEPLRVLVVDDNASVLRFLLSAFTANHCQVTTAATAEQALAVLGDDPFDLVVSDIKMPGLSGLDLLRAIKGKQPGTPVVLITGVPSVNSAVFGLRHGAYDYLPKPFSIAEVNELVQRLRRDRVEGNGNVTYPAGLTAELERRQGGVEVMSGIGELALAGLDPSVFIEKVLEKTIQSLHGDAAVVLIDTISSFVIALESKDPYLKGHSARVSLYAGELAKVMGLPPSDIVLHGRAGLLHDLGKLVMLDNILRKPRQLTDEEFELIRSHPVVGDKILKPLRFLACEAKAVRHHHERYDGKGYPDGLAGEGIPLIARVVTVADSFDAMTSDRPYRAKRPIEAALEEIHRNASTQFDPAIAKAFVTIPMGRLEHISRHLDLHSAPLPGAPLSVAR